MARKRMELDEITKEIKKELENAKAKVAVLQAEKTKSGEILNEYRGFSQVLSSYHDMLSYQGQRVEEQRMEMEFLIQLLEEKGMTKDDIFLEVEKMKQQYFKDMAEKMGKPVSTVGEPPSPTGIVGLDGKPLQPGL